MQATSELEGLPAPTGRHGVGRVSFDWVDQGRAEVYSSNAQDRRELVVWIWYPATPDPDAERAAYDAEKSITFDGWRTVHRRARPGYTMQVRGATHVSFMDVPLLPLADGSSVKAMLAATQIEPRRMWRVTCDVLLAFFAHHLGQAAATPPVLAGPSGAYPELTFGPP
jgi:hypothetical protein